MINQDVKGKGKVEEDKAEFENRRGGGSEQDSLTHDDITRNFKNFDNKTSPHDDMAYSSYASSYPRELDLAVREGPSRLPVSGEDVASRPDRLVASPTSSDRLVTVEDVSDRSGRDRAEVQNPGQNFRNKLEIAVRDHERQKFAEIKENIIESFKNCFNDAINALKNFGEHLMTGIKHEIGIKKWKENINVSSSLLDKSLAMLQKMKKRIGDEGSRLVDEVKKMAEKMKGIGESFLMVTDLKDQSAEWRKKLGENTEKVLDESGKKIEEWEKLLEEKIKRNKNKELDLAVKEEPSRLSVSGKDVASRPDRLVASLSNSDAAEKMKGIGEHLLKGVDLKDQSAEKEKAVKEMQKTLAEMKENFAVLEKRFENAQHNLAMLTKGGEEIA
jgi:hypothetical protein